MDLFFIIGIFGMAFLLFSFVMNQLNIWKNDDLRYDGLNFVGSVCLVIYAIPPLSWPFIILNSVWAIFSLRDVFLDLRVKKNK